MLFFLVPHCDDQNEDWSNATFEDAEEGAADCKTGETGASCMAAEDKTPEHDVDAEIQSESGDVLR